MAIGSSLRDMLGLAKGASPAPPAFALAGAMLSHAGCVRTVNEDTVAYLLPDAGSAAGRRGSLALVADGMGGHAAGAIASQLAVETVYRLYYELDGPIPEVLSKSFAAANEAIWQRSQSDPACAGMGTTCTAMAIRDNRVYLAHIGDSRAYVLRGGQLYQISRDHSLVAELVRNGTLTQDAAERSPQRNVILRALGTKPLAEPAIWDEGLPLEDGDVLILCSDGLSDLVDDDTMCSIIAGQSHYEACQALIDAALAAGGHDNISVGLFVVGGSAPDVGDCPDDTVRITQPKGDTP